MLGVHMDLTLTMGEYWRLLAASYIHFNLSHIAFNIFALLIWGGRVSERLGFLRFTFFYTICGILASLVSVTYQPEVVAAGASGAISGVLAELFVLRFAGDPTIDARGLVSVFIYNAVFSAAMPNIDWRAHAGGFATGLIVGYALLLTVPRKRVPLVAAGTAEAPSPSEQRLPPSRPAQ
jgi:rhomboid protease GluP